MPESPSREEMKAAIELAEARTDTKIARMEGKLDLVISKIDALNVRFEDARRDARDTRGNIWFVGLGLAVLIVGVVTLFPVFFSIGIHIRDLVHSEMESQGPPPPKTTR
jgi:hypothetical protein